MSLSIDDLKGQLADAVRDVRPGIPDPLAALYARDKTPIHRPGFDVRSTSFRRRSIAVFAIGLAICLVILVGIGVTRSPSQKATTNPDGTVLSVVRLRPDGPATPSQLDRDAAVLLRRLQIAGTRGAHARVSKEVIVVTSAERHAKLQSVLKGLLAQGNLFIRPVICAAPSFDPSVQPNRTSAPLPTTCPGANLLNAENNQVDVNTGTTGHSPDAWSALSGYPSTSVSSDLADSTVLLPYADWTRQSYNCQVSTPSSSGSTSEECVPNPDAGDRLLLGPAALTGADFASARVVFQSPSWIIDATLDSQSSRVWDDLSLRQFHAFVAFDLDGTIFSVPITEPSQSSFVSFDGQIQISGSIEESAARNLADILESGPLPVPLVETTSSGR
jgi:hypothetical protein